MLVKISISFHRLSLFLNNKSLNATQWKGCNANCKSAKFSTKHFMEKRERYQNYFDTNINYFNINIKLVISVFIYIYMSRASCLHSLFRHFFQLQNRNQFSKCHVILICFDANAVKVYYEIFVLVYFCSTYFLLCYQIWFLYSIDIDVSMFVARDAMILVLVYLNFFYFDQI